METENYVVIRCLNCGSKNRIPKERFQEHPKCGHCHAPLDEMIIRCLNCGAKNRMPENRLDAHPRCGRCGAPLVVESLLREPVDVSDATFSQEVLTYNGSVLVDCWAAWCGHCRTLSPILEEMAVKYAGRVKIAKLNVDENPVIAQQFSIRSIPTMLFFKQGKLMNSLIGMRPQEEIEKELLSILKTD